MANNCIKSTTVTVQPAEVVDAITLELTEFKNIKWIVDVRDATAEEVAAYEITASYSIGPTIEPLFSKYSVLGDDIEHVFNMVYDQPSNTIKVQITNNGTNDIEVNIGEVERVE